MRTEERYRELLREVVACGGRTPAALRKRIAATLSRGRGGGEGRPPMIDARSARQRKLAGESVQEIADDLGVSRSAVYAAIKSREQEADAIGEQESSD